MEVKRWGKYIGRLGGPMGGGAWELCVCSVPGDVLVLRKVRLTGLERKGDKLWHSKAGL